MSAKNAVYPILLTPSEGEAMAALEWLGEHETLPRLLINVRVSLEYSIGRGSLMAALADRREASADA